MVCWLYQRTLEPTIQFIDAKFGKRAEVAEANKRRCGPAGSIARTLTRSPARTPSPRPSCRPGLYRHITGNQATALGIAAAGQKAGLPVFYGSYPITPASDILHQLSRYKHLNVTTVQAEDEIAAICSAIGASFAGALAFTGTSGPGSTSSRRRSSLAIITELPLVVVDVQRGGPSTGLPTKTEQADLLPPCTAGTASARCPIIAACQPVDCFLAVYERPGSRSSIARRSSSSPTATSPTAPSRG